MAASTGIWVGRSILEMDWSLRMEAVAFWILKESSKLQTVQNPGILMIQHFALFCVNKVK